MDPVDTQGLLPQSKKIQKRKNETHKPETKNAILRDLEECIIDCNNNVGSPNEEFLTDNLSNLISLIKLEKYNCLLREVLPKHIPEFVSSTEALRAWRKKIKEWTATKGDSGYCGHPIVPPHKDADFNEWISEIVKDPYIRSFDLLRSKILEKLQEYQNEEQENYDYKLNDPNNCSETWWCNYRKKHSDLDLLWKSLPLARTETQRLKKLFSEMLKDPKEELLLSDETVNAFDDLISMNNGLVSWEMEHK